MTRTMYRVYRCRRCSAEVEFPWPHDIDETVEAILWKSYALRTSDVPHEDPHQCIEELADYGVLDYVGVSVKFKEEGE